MQLYLLLSGMMRSTLQQDAIPLSLLNEQSARQLPSQAVQNLAARRSCRLLWMCLAGAPGMPSTAGYLQEVHGLSESKCFS